MNLPPFSRFARKVLPPPIYIMTTIAKQIVNAFGMGVRFAIVVVMVAALYGLAHHAFYPNP